MIFVDLLKWLVGFLPEAWQKWGELLIILLVIALTVGGGAYGGAKYTEAVKQVEIERITVQVKEITHERDELRQDYAQVSNDLTGIAQASDQKAKEAQAARQGAEKVSQGIQPVIDAALARIAVASGVRVVTVAASGVNECEDSVIQDGEMRQ